MNLRVPGDAIQAVLARRSIDRAVWLYLDLLTHALPGGTTIRTRPRLAEDLNTSEEEVECFLDRLAAEELVEIQSPSPYLAIRLRAWPSRGASRAETSEEERAEDRIVPVSSKQAAEAAESIHRGDGGLGEGVSLRTEAREVVGDAESLDALLAQYPESIIRRAIQRVRATPERQIRKSRLALFRYLLAKFTNDAYVHPPTHHPQP